MNKNEYEQLITNIPDYPKPGVIFKDLCPLFESKLSECIDDLCKLIKNKPQAIVGIEARGFILGSALAQKMNIGFIPIRKKGKLPPPVFTQSYDLEYGSDTLELSQSIKSQKVVLIDDVLATGGTLRAALSLLESTKVEVTDILCLINLKFLNDFTDERLAAVLTYE